MADKPRIAIVGAGNLGSALAVSLRQADYKIDAVLARSGGGSSRRARALARKVGAKVLVDSLGSLRADVIWFCVPDGEIARAAGEFMARAKWSPAEWKRKVALHSSGVLLSDELSALRRRGALAASMHPLMTFVRGSRPGLRGVPFAIEGDVGAVRVARGIVRELGGDAYVIRKTDKAAYHAWGTFASPLLTALLATTERVAGLAGVKGKSARKRMMPILLQTLENYANRRPEDAFSGPIIRGDVDTVRRHLRVLRELPAAREVYVALARAAVQYLPAKNRIALRRVLRSAKLAEE